VNPSPPNVVVQTAVKSNSPKRSLDLALPDSRKETA
jgi:hypothetical protein